MAIRIDEDGVVHYENSPDVNRKLFPNLNICGKEIDKLEEEINGKAPAVFSTTSGSIASFDNGADDMPLKSCVVSIDPIQEGSGDPSPENVRPISGRTGLSVTRCGKNILPITEIKVSPTIIGIRCTLNDDGSVHVDGTYGTANNNVIALGDITLMTGTYTLNGNTTDNSNAGYRLQVMKRTTNEVIGYDLGNGLTFTVTEKSDYMVRIHITASLAYNNPINTVMYPMISLDGGEYEPYKGSTYSVNWESEAGTVYGGTLDVISGKLVVDSANIASYNGETLPSTWISDRDVYAEGTTPSTGAQVVYKIAEPVEYRLTPQEIRTLLGENNIWSDAGSMDVKYPADTKMYIEKLTTPTEDDMIADHEILENSFFMVGNTLYRAITTIASGATITPGTNAVKLSLSDALNALA